MTDAELSASLRINLREYKTLQARTGPLSMLELPGVRAYALPRRQDNLFQQQVLYEDPRALTEALAPLEAWYREQGVSAWRVPVPPGHATAEAALARSGYRHEDTLPVMGIALTHPPPLLPPGTTLERPDDLDEVLTLNGVSYGQTHVDYFRTWKTRPLPSPQLYAVLVREGGRALAGGMSYEQDGIAGIYLVATHPDARRRGLGALVMHALHADARARGNSFAVLQASPMGHGLYQRLGYRDVSVWNNWVRRTG